MRLEIVPCTNTASFYCRKTKDFKAHLFIAVNVGVMFHRNNRKLENLLRLAYNLMPYDDNAMVKRK